MSENKSKKRWKPSYEGKARIWSAVTPEVDAELVKWSDRLGISKAQLVNMSVQAGLGAIIRAVAPEEAISPEIMAMVVSEMEKQGLEVKKPEKSG